MDKDLQKSLKNIENYQLASLQVMKETLFELRKLNRGAQWQQSEE